MGRTAPRTPPASRLRAQSTPRFWLYVSALIAFVLIISYCNIRGLDVWWHIKTGEWIAQHGAIPFSDPFSYTAAGKPWVSHEWLFGLLTYGVHAAGGVPGIVLFKMTMVAATLALAAWLARIRGAAGGITLLVLTAAYAIGRARFAERPELLSLPIAVGFLLAYEKSRSRSIWLALLPGLQLLWVNAHGGTALLGCALAFAFLLDRARDLKTADIGWLQDRRFLWCACSCAGVVAASLLNPHGYSALVYGLLRTESPLDNREFQSFLTLASKGIDLSIALSFVFAVLLLWSYAVRPSRVRTYEWLLLPMLAALTLVFFRFRPLLVFLLAPSLAWHLGQWNWPGRLRSWLPALLAAVLMARVAVLENRTYFYRFGPAVHSGVFPSDAVEFLKAHGVSGNMFNSYSLGGYLIWSLGPHQKVFIDGREDVYLKPGVLLEYVHAFDSPEAWRALVQKYGIDFAVVQYPETPPANAGRSLDLLAFPRSDWALVYFDDVAAVYVRRNGKNEGALRYEIRTVQPFQLSSYMDPLVNDPTRLELFRAELAQNAREHPMSFRNRFTAGLLALKLNTPAEALSSFEQASSLNPDFVPAHLNRGSIYLHLGRTKEAEAAFRAALSIEKNVFASEQLESLRRSPR